MKRLTKRMDGKAAFVHGTCYDPQQVCDFLAAYEDTGLEPEEIKQMCALARLNSNIFDNDFGNHIAELIVAEQDGRLVVLPCKVGDTVFMTLHGYIEQTKVRTFFIGHPSFSDVPFDPNYYMVRLENYDMPLRDFGKVLFLTREEAEAALRNEQSE